MALDFQSVTLANAPPDTTGMLVFREGRLIAALTCLGDIHAELDGRWFLEAAFGELPLPRPDTFGSLAEFEAWLTAPHGA